jgi:hypothetical protein
MRDTQLRSVQTGGYRWYEVEYLPYPQQTDILREWFDFLMDHYPDCKTPECGLCAMFCKMRSDLMEVWKR